MAPTLSEHLLRKKRVHRGPIKNAAMYMTLYAAFLFNASGWQKTMQYLLA
jgi:hypothetical protein